MYRYSHYQARLTLASYSNKRMHGSPVSTVTLVADCGSNHAYSEVQS